RKPRERSFTEASRYLYEIRPRVLYYYSKYERTTYRRLREKYPQVCSVEELNALFDPRTAVDLYNDVVRAKTEWPTRDYSIKTLAKYLGFHWRDPHLSGTASIEWYDRWTVQKAPKLKERILAYNEDDWRATRVLDRGLQNARFQCPFPAVRLMISERGLGTHCRRWSCLSQEPDATDLIQPLLDQPSEGAHSKTVTLFLGILAGRGTALMVPKPIPDRTDHAPKSGDAHGSGWASGESRRFVQDGLKFDS
ncbi:MAG: ribonuclease H-like domain-containing protein, partial [bacterium]